MYWQSRAIWFGDFGFVLFVSTEDSWEKAEMGLAIRCREDAQPDENQKFRIESTKPGEHPQLETSTSRLRGNIDARFGHNIAVLHQMQGWHQEGWGGFDITVTGTNIHKIHKASCLLGMFNMMSWQYRCEGTMSTMTLH